ncbi:MAG TPA: triple tyrosine motif-containing protein, partial [Chitinophagaceae bacterium]|nr:triple tyrosine motif-containing protein [Chitinophagaceae bacterium]
MAAHRYTKILLALAFTFSLAGAHAQLPDYHLQLIDYLAGIRPGNIIAVTRDQKGFLWILYPRSIQRFDGRRATSFKIKGEMRHVHCDENGRLWASASRKIFCYDDESRNFKEVKVAGTDSTTMMGMVFNMPGKRTWLVTSTGFFEYDAKQQQFKKILHDLPVKPPYNHRSFGAHQWSIFFGHEGWVYRYNIQSRKLDSLAEIELMRIYPANGDSVLVSSWNSHSYWYDFAARRVTEAQPPATVRIKQPGSAFTVRGLCEVAPGRFFIPSIEGFFEYDMYTRQYRRLQLYHKGISISTADFANYIYYDTDGYIWLSTIDGIGRFPLHGQSFGLLRIRQLKDELSVGIDNIRNIAEDNKGNLWLATGSGFVCWERQQNKWHLYPAEEGSKEKLGFPSVRGIVHDGKYVILGPANLGIRLFEPQTQRYRLPNYASAEVKNSSDHDFFDAITTLRNGHHLFMGRDALYILNGKNYTLDFVNNPASAENTNFALQGKNGLIWLATQRGLHLLDSNVNYLQQVKLPASNPYISAGYMLPDDRFLFALEGGLYTATYHNGSVRISKFTSLLDNIFINALCQDDNGFIWIMSENGIYRLDPRNQKLNLFDHSDNVQGYGFNNNSWHKTKDGILFIGGINGLNYIRPGQFSTSADSLKVFIEQVRGGGNDTTAYSLNKKAVLSYAKRSLEVEFVSPYFNNPEKLMYRYRLEGFDQNWNYTGHDNSVRFTSLPPGHYTLLVEASINNVDWIRAQNSFSFRIKPP